MRRIIILLILFTFFVKIESNVFATDWTQDDGGIQKNNTNSIPQITLSGKIQQLYTSDSFFPIALYFTDLGRYGQAWSNFNLDDQTSRDTLPEVKTAGFNTLWPSWWLPTKGELDHINQFGLKVYPNLSNYIVMAVQENDWQILKKAINSIKDNPTILAWHLFDERPPIDIPMNQWLEIYKTIASSDDHHHAIFANTDRQAGACSGYGVDFTAFDFLSTSLYAIGVETKSLAPIGDVIDQMSSCRKGGQPIFPILQAFRGDLWPVRPTQAQLRGQAYTAIVHGATGIWWFLQHTPWAWHGADTVKDKAYWYQDDEVRKFGGISPQVTPDLWEEISRVNHEIETNKQIFLSRTSPEEYHVFYKGIAGHPFHTVLKDTEDKGVRYLVAVSVVPDAYDVQITFSNSFVKVTDLLSGKIIASSNKSFSDAVNNYATRLYKVEFALSLPGDLNQDGKVDIFDYNILVQNFSKTGANVADINNDGKVDIFDYNILVGNFGKVTISNLVVKLSEQRKL